MLSIRSTGFFRLRIYAPITHQRKSLRWFCGLVNIPLSLFRLSTSLLDRSSFVLDAARALRDLVQMNILPNSEDQILDGLATGLVSLIVENFAESKSHTTTTDPA